MSFKEVKQRSVWCIHFWDMSLCKGLVLGGENDSLYVRTEGAAIIDVQLINSKNVFYSKDDAEKALFKANLAGKKRPANKDIRDIK